MIAMENIFILFPSHLIDVINGNGIGANISCDLLLSALPICLSAPKSRGSLFMVHFHHSSQRRGNKIHLYDPPPPNLDIKVIGDLFILIN